MATARRTRSHDGTWAFAGFPADRVELCCDGLDSYASIWLNGAFVGCHANRFVLAVFDVGPYLRLGENEIGVLNAAAPVRPRE